MGTGGALQKSGYREFAVVGATYLEPQARGGRSSRRLDALKRDQHIQIAGAFFAQLHQGLILR